MNFVLYNTFVHRADFPVPCGSSFGRIRSLQMTRYYSIATSGVHINSFDLVLGNIPGPLGQQHGRWCRGSLRHNQVIVSHNVDMMYKRF